MAKEKIDSTREAAKSDPKPSRKRAPALPKKDANAKAATQEAKDLRALVTMLHAKNAPETSKDITAFANETLKVVAKSQKSESAAFRREATKALIDFRNFVEQTTKVTETRRAQLLSKIDNATLDTKNAAMMLISVAKTQAKNVRLSAAREAQARKLEIKEMKKKILAEATTEAKRIKEEAALKSKAMREEQESKLKLLSEERREKFKLWQADKKQKLEERELKLKEQREAMLAERDKRDAAAKEQAKKFKEQKETHAADLAKKKDELAKAKSQSRNHYKNLQQQQKDVFERKKLAFEADKAKQKADLAQQSLDLKMARADAATKIKKLKNDLRDDYQNKMRVARADIAKRKADLAQQSLDLKTARADAATKIKKLKNDLRDDYQNKMRAARADIAKRKAEQIDFRKRRMQKLKQVEVEHKAKLKKIQEEATMEAMLRKQAFKKRLAEDEKRESKRKAARANLGNKVKEGIYEANPLLHAAIEIGAGIGIEKMYSKWSRKRKEKKEKKDLNRLKHTQNVGKPATAAPVNGGGATPSSPAGNAPSTQGGGFLTGLASGVSGLISGIGSLFTGIMGAFTKVGPLLMNGLRFLPGIAQVASIFYGIYSFIEGFNDATSLFGDKITDDDYVRRIYSGFTNVFGSILGIFDTVAGWLGFDTDLEGSFKENAVKVFNAIVNTFKSLLGGVADLLAYIPGMGSTAQSLKAYSESKTPGDFQPSQANTASALNAKTNAVNDLKDQVEAKKGKGGAVQVVQDNSVKQNSTTIVQGKLDTRNNDSPDRYTGKW